MAKTLKQTGYAPKARDLDQFEGQAVIIMEAQTGASPSYGRRATLHVGAVDWKTGEQLSDLTRCVSFGEAVLETVDYLLAQGLCDGTVANAVIVKVVKEGALVRLVDPDEGEGDGAEPARTTEA